MNGRSTLATIAWLALVSLGTAHVANAAEYPDPQRYRAAIEAFVQSEAESPAPKGAIVATGSSSMRGWHHRIATDLAPLTVVPRGFGGSNMRDVRHFLEDLVLRHEPRAVLLYEGDNDIAFGATPEQVLAHFDAIAAALRQRLPQTRLYVLAIKPSIARWHLWPEMEATNALLAGRAETDENITFIDIATPMLNHNGEPRTNIFVADNLHMNDAGYDIWRNTVRPILVDAEAHLEQ